MNLELMEQLLNEEESSSLDFKRDQYPYIQAPDDVKGELLKDILAFANAWRRTDAYILIGVDEIKGGRSLTVGVQHHLADNDLQQFVNSKTQRPLTFSYRAFPFDGVQIGVITIPLQDRPFYLKKDFGKLRKNVVYVRRGSSTDEADPDEIAKMGTATAQARQEPTLELHFADHSFGKRFGTSITIISEVVSVPESSNIPLVKRRSPFEEVTMRTNQSYYREMAKYIANTSLLKPVSFSIANTGTTLASNVRMMLTIGRAEGLTVLDENRYPERPAKTEPYIRGGRYNFVRSKIGVRTHEDVWVVTADFGNAQPKAVEFIPNYVYVGANAPCLLNLEAELYADNLSDPIRTPLTIDIQCEHKVLDLSDLLKK